MVLKFKAVILRNWSSKCWLLGISKGGNKSRRNYFGCPSFGSLLNQIETEPIKSLFCLTNHSEVSFS